MSNKPVYLQCDCHTPYHFLSFELDDDDPDSIIVSYVSTKSGRFWHRVKWALKHVFGQDSLVFADIIVKRSTLKQCVDEIARAEKGETK